MTNFDDEMRRMFADRRIGQVPNPPSVADLVQGASRRRTRRVVVSAVSAAGVVAAVAVGATALVDFTNTASPDVVPAVTSTSTADPTPPPSEPTEDPTVDPTTPPSDPSTDPSEPSDPPDETEPPDDSTDPADDDVPVLDPEAGYDGVELGMTLRELRQVEGIEIEEFTADQGRNDACYGTYRIGEVSGLIGIPGTDEQADPEDLFMVASLAFDGPFQTPEGITVGSSLEEVQTAYSYLSREPNYATAPASRGWWVFDGIYANGTDGGDTVTDLYIDLGHSCYG